VIGRTGCSEKRKFRGSVLLLDTPIEVTTVHDDTTDRRTYVRAPSAS
jgi:hypothetical protein